MAELVKRGRPRKIVVVDDINVEEQIVLKKIANDSIEQKDFKIKDLNFSEILPNCVDDVVVSVIDNRRTVFLTPNMGKISWANWLKGRGGVFNKDVNNYLKGKSIGKYILLKDKKDQYIARIINEDEFLDFFSLKLIDGKIKDVSYMILKQILPGEGLISTKLPVHEEEPVAHELIKIPTPHIDQVDDHHEIDNPLTSISLFED